MPSPATVTGNVQNIFGANSIGGSVVFELVNLHGNLPRVTGTTIVAIQKVSAATDASGNFSVQLWGNDNIAPAGTYYSVTFAGGPTGYWQITGATANLNSLAQITVVPVVTAPTGDTTYLRLDAGNNLSSLNVLPFSIHDFGSQSGSLTLSMTAIIQKLTLGGNLTLATPASVTPGSLFELWIIQNATTASTVTFPSNMIGAGPVSPALGTNNIQLFVADSTGANFYAVSPMVSY